jgi:hypothetical protein
MLRTFYQGEAMINCDELEAVFARLEIHPGDLKVAAEVRLDQLLDPVRKIFLTARNEETDCRRLSTATKMIDGIDCTPLNTFARLAI